MDQDAIEKWNPPPRRRVYLMRHGEVDYFAPDGRPLRPETLQLDARQLCEKALAEFHPPVYETLFGHRLPPLAEATI